MTERKLLRSIAGATVIITLLGLITRGTGFVREILLANYFGLGADFDVYLVSIAFPLIIINTVTYLGQNYFVPKYNRIKSIDADSANHFTGYNLFIFTAAGSIITFILYIYSYDLLKSYLTGAGENELRTAVRLFNYFILSIPPASALSIITAYLNAEFRFDFPAYARLANNLFTILFIIILNSIIGIDSVPLALTVGMFLQFFLLYFYIRKISGVHIVLKFSRGSNSLKFDPDLIFVTLTEIIMLSFILIDRAFLTKVSPGGVAALNYAYTLYSLPISVLSIALGTAFLSKFSESASMNDDQALKNQLYNGIRITSLLYVPILFIFIVFGSDLIYIIFQRGKFDSSGTGMTNTALIYYSISLVFYAIFSLITKYLYGTHSFRYLLFIAVSGLIIKATLNIYFVDLLDFSGLALSTTIAYIVMTVFSLIPVARKIPGIIGRSSIDFIFFIIVSGASIISAFYIPSLAVDINSPADYLFLILFPAIFILNILVLNGAEVSMFDGIIAEIKIKVNKWKSNVRYF